MKKSDSNDPVSSPDVAYETRDVNGFALLLVGIGIVACAFVINFAVLGAFHYFVALDRQQGLEPSTMVPQNRSTRPPEPRLQIDPARDLKMMRSAETNILETYGWVDRKTGVVRIPIEQAMKEIALRDSRSLQPAVPTNLKPGKAQ